MKSVMLAVASTHAAKKSSVEAASGLKASGSAVTGVSMPSAPMPPLDDAAPSKPVGQL